MTSDRIKVIQEGTAYPESLSVKQALLQVWNECEQEQNRIKKEIELEWYRELEKKLKDVSYYASYDWGVADNVWEYYNEIQNKIKELENEN